MIQKKKATAAAHETTKRCKGTDYISQFKTVKETFQEPMTALMCSRRTGFLQGNIYRYIKLMVDNGEIQKIETKPDPITHNDAGWYTTNKSLWIQREEKQLSLDFWGGIEL